jgi:hypothetical protein
MASLKYYIGFSGLIPDVAMAHQQFKVTDFPAFIRYSAPAQQPRPKR